MDSGKEIYDKAQVLHDKIVTTGEVSREEIAPYIEQLPPYVTLESFSEDPSSRGVEMATEGLAAFVKVGIAIAVVASIGGLIWYLVSSRKKTQDMAENAADYQALLAALIDFESFIQISQLNGLNTSLRDEVGKIIGKSMSHEVDQLAGNAFLHHVFENKVFLSSSVDQWLTPESVAMTPAIERLRKFVADNKSKISDTADKDLEEIGKLVGKLSILDKIEATFGGEVDRLKQQDGEDIIQRGLRYVGEIENYFEARTTKKTDFTKNISSAALDFRLVDLIRKSNAEPQRLKSFFTTLGEACKSANEACDRIKNDAKSANFSKAHEEQLEKVIADIADSVKTAERLIDLVSLEQRSVHAFIKFCSSLFKLEYVFAQEVDKKDNMGLEKDLKRLGENIAKAAKKIKR